MGGLMTYMADAALFEECMTGRRYPVSQEGAYIALERAYLKDRASPGAPLYVHVEGGLLMRPAMEGPDRRSLVVTRFIRTRPGITCERQRANAALTNTYWRIDRLGEDELAANAGRREAHVVLLGGDEPRFRATVGCNSMMGGYTAADGELSFADAMSTMMACPGPLAALEQKLSETLAAARGYRISGETLAVYDGGGEVIALLTAVYLR
jgi:copper homeostasis protein (lipoprotein)